MIILEFLKSYIHILVSVIVGLVILYIRTLIVEKAKNRVLRKENKTLTEESEKIKSKYNKEIENIKKEYQLEIEKRKYQYESKKEQYIKFFRKIDDFNGKLGVEMQKKMILFLEEFNRDYFHAVSRNNKEGETNATILLSKKIQELMFEASTELEAD